MKKLAPLILVAVCISGCASTPYYSAYLPQEPQAYIAGSCSRNMCSLPTAVYGAFPKAPPGPERKVMDDYLDSKFSIADPTRPKS